ncbi:GNAT family N-acetyltransferase [Streptomyces sp. NPDC050418]|uniref:GNAT family N-acetyltransferase n=1 Tax=Streptomyces sp. NPDC050418 TaxID=3365612 RepID=UPI0037AF91AF
MPALQRLSPEHAPALLAFEQENRAYFAASVPDRGDAFFAAFDAVMRDRLAEQEAGECHFHVLVDTDGAILGRVNLVDVADGEAELGYRIAKAASGRGLATDAVRQVCALAAERYGLRTLRAVTTTDNGASRAVLARTGFVATGEIVIGDQPGTAYRKELSTPVR